MSPRTRPGRTRLLSAALAAVVLTTPVLAAAAAASPAAALTGGPAPAAVGDVLWSQEFDGPAGTSPDTTQWRFDTGANGWGNAELQNYTTSRDNSALDGEGNLVLTARKQADGSYTSARLTTKGKVALTYGRIEARIKLPKGQGIWPAFWMLGDNNATWPATGEIDIMEYVGKEPNYVYGTVHGPGYLGAGGISGAYRHPQNQDFADAFHTYAIDWKPGEITWLVDGQQYHRVTRSDVGANPWLFDAPFYLLLNVAVGGEWPGYPDATTSFPQQMKVDWIRVVDNGANPTVSPTPTTPPRPTAAPTPVTPTPSATPRPSTPPAPQPSATPTRPATPTPTPTPTPKPTPGPLPTGSGTIRADGTLCLDVPWAKTHDGNPIQIVHCNRNVAQDWTRGADGTVRALGKCLDVAGGATRAGTQVQLWACNGTKAQQWRFDASTGALRNPQSGKCLDAKGGLPLSDGQRVIIWTCHGGANQRWVL
ncbi:glycoside hydrolase family 16 protein [Cellulomonas phragmiteti]|uniref:GH16 domain-containing protein n=1 Tax=Cellulomonas phragmiteti TaxID=478780 RepID=A0ABQ4DR05_9CELL|nr:glycoside hydrolase family 16 protein [Cellulomonas phragmiteti]GIG41780.1 hypothetical protein Cph01nite_35420 [Cellulomonas phragmiteti]